MSNIFSLNLKNIAGAIVFAVIAALLAYVVSLTDVYAFSVHTAVNIAVLSAASSLLKDFFTDSTGAFAGTGVLVK